MKLSYDYKNDTIEFELEYRSRKTLSIEVRAPGNVRVLAPRGLDQGCILDSVIRKSEWILEKLAESRKAGDRNRKRECADGERFVMLGREVELRLVADPSLKSPRASLHEDHIRVAAGRLEEDSISKAVERLYREKAMEAISDSVRRHQHLFAVEPSVVRIKTQRKRWGSCSSKRALNFNWKCVMAPRAIIDYIVVHEMCHMVHMNHSRDFWNLVGSILPDWNERRTWLRKNGVMHDV